MRSIDSIGSPALWLVTVGAVIALLAVDFALTRRPHAVTVREAVGWSTFYVALSFAFTLYVWGAHGGGNGLDYLTGYLVEKSLSVDNLFVFIVLLGAFAVPAELQQRVLLYGIAGALLLRTVFIVLGAAAIAAFDEVFLLFGMILVFAAVKLLCAARGGQSREIDIARLRSVRALRRIVPVTERYEGPRVFGRIGGHRAITPFAVVVVAVLTTDVVFAVDSVPAVYGITGDPYLVFVTNAFALLGLRALYFLLHGALDRLAYLDYGLAAVLGFIGVKLGLHWAHGVWPAVPQIPTLLSLAVILVVLAVTVGASVRRNRNRNRKPAHAHR
ncbi:TerC/Alx family metal homeostasis membrane protein [Mycobacterium syngnathidarum]|uniref:Tellurium resistance protein TerC n=1 Tax=Mycobacterium syngnathidarum TaxID=1908205 RepID=A0A1S1JW52_9MYCO|nr:TerC/Alx family metal homeostasis membrane protein [Mycobacterium syngnathidarum]OHT92557.1 tellurium resistance protein TerC [Mycobacterium syngnathidarum]